MVMGAVRCMITHSVSNQLAPGKRLRVIMLLTRFLHPDKPASGVFNVRAAKALSHSVDITVIHLRARKASRCGIQLVSWEEVPMITRTVPQVRF
jgi:hypothetical protein